MWSLGTIVEKQSVSNKSKCLTWAGGSYLLLPALEDPQREREFFIVDKLVRIHFIIEMI
jgi:hypothetical protein